MPDFEDNHLRKHKRCRRHCDPGQAHALTFSCFKRRAFLSRDRSRMWMVDALRHARERHHFHIWAYVIMPEHVHILLFPLDRHYSISRILADIKQPVSRRALAYVRDHAPSFLPMMRDEQPNGQMAHRFWQRGGGYDRNLIEPATIHSEIEYIHNNPVRRQLATRADEWLWSSAAFFTGRSEVPLVPDVEFIPRLGQQG